MFRMRAHKATPKVVNGKVQRKNRTAVTPTYFNTPQAMPVIDRLKPGFGYRHVLKKKDVQAFIELLPDWKELSKGLNAVLLTPGEHNVAGWHRPGIVAICAWQRDLWIEIHAGYYRDNRNLFARIGVPCEETAQGVLCKWTESTLRAYQLLDVLLHELGHHHDRMTTKSRRRCGRGEEYAEQYALRYADMIWDRYLDRFGLP